MNERITKVVVVGGGTAGWMTAAYLSKVFDGQLQIDVIEAADVPRIGVGEATIPNLQRVFFDQLGLAEDDWMRACNGSLKAGIKFINWRRAPSDGAAADYFYHTFGLTPMCEGIPVSRLWALRRAEGDDQPYDRACLLEPPLLDANRSPRYLDGRRLTSYAWHFDASLVAEYIKKFAMGRQGVRHIVDHVDDVALDERGFIASLKMRTGRVIDGDLFVDCSGFTGLLLNRAMKEPFVDMSDYLLCDRAVAVVRPHDDEATGVEPYTSAIAMPAGWVWRIPLRERFGSGYVYSSRCTTRDEAVEDFCRLWDIDSSTTRFNEIQFRVGRNRRSWVKNCVAIGLSSCFLEPLESTGLYFIYAAIHHLAKNFPDRSFAPTLIDNFNREIELMFDDCRDFIQAHYILSSRADTEFWRLNRSELKISDQLRLKMEMYAAGIPINPVNASADAYYSNFELEFRNFWTDHSYYCIFAGLGFPPRDVLPSILYRPDWCRKAEEMLWSMRAHQAELLDSVPSMQEFLGVLHRQSDSVATASIVG